MLGADHQALYPLGAADKVVQSGFKQGLESLGEYGSRAPESRNVKPSDETLAVIQRAQGVDTALKAEFQVKVGGLRSVLLEHRKRNVMARANGEQLVPRVAGLGENSREIVSQCFDVRLQARASPTLCPEQSLGKLGWTSALPLRPHDERLAELSLPFFKRAPDVPVRTPEHLCGVSDGTALEYGCEDLEKGIVDCSAALLAWLEGVP